MNLALTTRQITCWSIIYFISGWLFLGNLNVAGHSIFLTLPIGGILALPLLYLYGKFATKLLASKLVKIVLAGLSLCLGVLYIFLIASFISACILPTSPQLLTGGLLMIFSLWFASHSIETFGIYSKIIIPIILLLSLCLMMAPLPSINPLYAVDILIFKPDSFKYSVLFFVVAFFIKGMIFINILTFYDRERSWFKAIKNGILPAVCLLSLAMIIVIFSLGTAVFDVLLYPTYYPLSITTSGNNVQHFEMFFLIVYGLVELLHLGTLFLYVKLSITSLAK